MPQPFASLHVHLVFSTKHREPRINLDLHPRLFEYIGGILRNLANQQDHHRQMTFQEEFRSLLRRHGLEWDERYVWD